jgi:hypothetical protein
MAVISFRDGRPLTDPWSLRCLIYALEVELEVARREMHRARGLPTTLYLVPDELEREWDSEDSNAYQDRVEAGLEPEDG